MKLRYAFKRTIANKSAGADKELKPEVPDGMLKKCNACKAAVFVDEVKKNAYICPHCGNYFRVHARRRIEMLADEGTFEEWDKELTGQNPMGYKGYEEKIQSLKEKTGLNEAVVTGKAVGPVFTAIAGSGANADFTYSYPDAVIAPFAAVTAVEFMWHDKLKNAENLDAERNKLAAEYEKTLASAQTAAENNFIDDVIDASQTRNVLIAALDILSGKRVQKLPKKHNNIPF